jgi:hypothetical protein
MSATVFLPRSVATRLSSARRTSARSAAPHHQIGRRYPSFLLHLLVWARPSFRRGKSSLGSMAVGGQRTRSVPAALAGSARLHCGQSSGQGLLPRRLRFPSIRLLQHYVPLLSTKPGNTLQSRRRPWCTRCFSPAKAGHSRRLGRSQGWQGCCRNLHVLACMAPHLQRQQHAWQPACPSVHFH